MNVNVCVMSIIFFVLIVATHNTIIPYFESRRGCETLIRCDRFHKNI